MLSERSVQHIGGTIGPVNDEVSAFKSMCAEKTEEAFRRRVPEIFSEVPYRLTKCTNLRPREIL